MQNRYHGRCACGVYVEIGEGVALREGARWLVRCAYCAAQAAAPERELLGTIYWPNGQGETACTTEYENAVGAARDARQALEDYGDTYDPHDRESVAWRNQLEHIIYSAENKVAELQLAGGHLGERIRYDRPDPMAALLGGGRITVAPGGAIGIAE